MNNIFRLSERQSDLYIPMMNRRWVVIPWHFYESWSDYVASYDPQQVSGTLYYSQKALSFLLLWITASERCSHIYLKGSLLKSYMYLPLWWTACEIHYTLIWWATLSHLEQEVSGLHIFWRPFNQWPIACRRYLIHVKNHPYHKNVSWLTGSV